MAWSKVYLNGSKIGSIELDGVTHTIYIVWIYNSFVFVENPNTGLGRWAPKDWLSYRLLDITWVDGFEADDVLTNGYTSYGMGVQWNTVPPGQPFRDVGYYYYYGGVEGTEGVAAVMPVLTGLVPANFEAVTITQKWSRVHKNGKKVGTILIAGVVHNIYIVFIYSSFVFVENSVTGLGRWAAKDWVKYKLADVTWEPWFIYSDVLLNGYTSYGIGVQWSTLPDDLGLPFKQVGYYYYTYGSAGVYGPEGEMPDLTGLVPNNSDTWGFIMDLEYLADYYVELNPSRNPVWVFVDAVLGDDLASPLDRSKVLYKGELSIREFANSPTLKVLQNFEGKERPPRIEDGQTIYDGWQIDLKSYVKGVLNRASPTDNVFSVDKTAVKNFTFKSSIEENGLALPEYDITHPTLLVIDSGLSANDYSLNKRNVFSKYFGSDLRFLSWHPAETRMVYPEEPVFLSFLINMSPLPLGVQLVVRPRLSSGYGSLIFYPGFSSNESGDILHLNLSPKVLMPNYFLQGDETDVLSYEVCLITEDGEPMSEVISFVINYAIPDSVVYVRFANTIGGWENIHLNKLSSISSISGITGQKVLPPDYGTDDEEFFVTDKFSQGAVELISDPLDYDVLKWLECLAWSEKIELLKDNEWISVYLPSMSYTKPLKGELGRRAFTFLKSKLDKGYSALPAADHVGDRPTAWIGSSEYCLLDEFGRYTGLKAFGKLKLHYTDVVPNEAVRGVASKLNIPDQDGYASPISAAECVFGNTPYLNELYSKTSNFRNNTCADGYKGGSWEIVIAAGSYGGQTQAEANARASEAAILKDTQQNANAYGACVTVVSGLYGQFWQFVPVGSAPPAGATDGAADATRVDAEVFFSNDFGLAFTQNFWGKWTGFFKAPITGSLFLGVKHDHACELRVEGLSLINSQAPNGMQLIEKAINVVEGNYYSIELDYWELTGYAGMKLYWRYGNTAATKIPAGNLFH